MNFSFIIPTGGGEHLDTVIHYILEAVPAENLEIILVGNTSYDHPNIINIPFDDTVKSKAWITRKKNLGAQAAKFENLVFMHDYIVPNPDNWYDGWLSFGDNYEVAGNVVLTMEGKRHSDWVACSYDLWLAAPELKDNYDVLLPYNVKGMNDVMYMSGNYWVAKKDFMLAHPLDESLVWGDAEDIEWSRRARKHTEFKINTHSSVHLIKPGKWAPAFLSQYGYEKLHSYFGVTPYYD
jgi:hypothetical protein